MTRASTESATQAIVSNPPRQAGHLVVVLILALGTFIIGTDAFVLAGLLDVVADTAGVSVAAAGQLGSAFALTYAVAGPVAARYTGPFPRRAVLGTALLVFAFGNVVFAASTTFGWLLAGRVIAAIGAAAFTPAAVASVHALSGALATRHISYVMTGMTAATVIGVPLSAFVANHSGYSPVFWALAVAGVVLAIVIPAKVPGHLRGAATPPSLIRAVRTPGSARTLGVTLLFFLGAFSLYSYVAPFTAHRAPTNTGLVTVVLLAFGIGGLLGNLVAGRFVRPESAVSSLRISLVGAVVTFVLIAVFPWPAVFVALAVLWGGWGWSILPSVQANLLRAGPINGPVLLSLNASAMYLGISLSGVVGGLIQGHFGAGPLPVASAVIVAVALIVTLRLQPVATVSPQAAAVGVGEGVET